MSPVNTKIKLAAVGAIAAVATGVGIAQATADPASSGTPSSGSSGGGAPSGGAASANSGTPGSGVTGSDPTDDNAGLGRHGRHGHGPDGGMGGHMGRGLGRGMDSAAFAEKLGVDEATLTAALQQVRAALRDAAGDEDHAGPPTEAERTARQQEFAAALAKELGIEQAKVTAALDALRAERQADARAVFSARLDEAVKAGTLTEADKAAVLKAFDAGVLGGPGRH